jgi:hypothetical protein
MAAHVADKIGVDAPLYESPLPVVALEAVVVPTADDGLQSQVGQRLERGEVGTRDRAPPLKVASASRVPTPAKSPSSTSSA